MVHLNFILFGKQFWFLNPQSNFMMNLVEQFIDIYQVDWCFVLVNMGNSFSVFLFTCLLVSCWVNLLLPFSWFALGGRWPASSRQEQKVRAYREIERQNMNKALIDYLNFYLSPNGGSVPSSVSSPAYEQLLVFWSVVSEIFKK